MSNVNSKIDDLIEISKIEGDIDTAILLRDRDLITEEDYWNLAEKAAEKLQDMFYAGRISTPSVYDLAKGVSDKIDAVDPYNDCFTLNHLKNHDFNETPEEMKIRIMEGSLHRKEKADLEAARESGEFRVFISGQRYVEASPLDGERDNYYIDYKDEIGAGISTISQALKEIDNHVSVAYNKNQALSENGGEIIGHVTFKEFTIEDKNKKAVFNGIWDKAVQSFKIPIPDPDIPTDKFKADIDLLNAEYVENTRADNHDTCRSISQEIQHIQNLLINREFAEAHESDGLINTVYDYNIKACPEIFIVHNTVSDSSDLNSGIKYYDVNAAQDSYDSILEYCDYSEAEYGHKETVSMYKIKNPDVRGVFNHDNLYECMVDFDSVELKLLQTNRPEKPSNMFSHVLKEIPEAQFVNVDVFQPDAIKQNMTKIDEPSQLQRKVNAP